ncbi:MAG: type II secretion system F family protein [Acidimicrobiales bacterium]|nr:type II secretion system F family protein [Acidimicrobiales bacterium]
MSTPTTDTTSSSEARAKARPFDYRALDADRNLAEGRITSSNEAEAVDRLRRMGLRPLEITPVRTPLLKRELSFGGGKKAKPGDLALFARQLATMVSAGLPLLRCLEVLRVQTTSPALEAAIIDISAAVEAGETLSVAMARHDRVFDDLFVSMVAAGEAAGSLDLVLSLMLLIVFAMLTFVVPVFEKMYADMGGELPLPTKVMVALSDLIRSWLPLVVAGVVGGVVAFRRWRRTPAGRYRWDRMMLRAPLVRSLVERAALARLGRTLAVLTRSGIPVLDALTISSRTVRNEVYARSLLHTAEAVRRGDGLAATLEEDGVLPPMATHLIAVGEQTGELDTMLDAIGGFYEEELDNAIGSFTSVLEPALMGLLGGTVGMMVIAMYLPMFKIIEQIQ